MPAGLLRPVPAAVTVYLAAALSLALFELVTIAGAAALLVAAYRLARAGSLVLAVVLGAPFLGARAGAGRYRLRGACGSPAASGLAAAATETRVLAVLLASAIPLATVAAMARGAREQSQSHSAAREDTEGMLADHLARGERARIARELHDVVAHHISMIAVQAETGRLTTPGLPAAGAQRFAAIGDTARAGLTEMRRLLGVLREDAEQDTASEPVLQPAAPDLQPAGPGRRPQPGLPQLGDLVDGAREASGGVVRLIMSGQADRLDPGVELAAYRIVQEALTNARRHAPGAAVDVELRYADDALRLRIRDNGPGQAPRYHAGHGLLGMRERAAAVGGSLQTGDARGGGFCVEAELPAKVPDAMTGRRAGQDAPVSIGIVVADDHEVVRAGFAALLDTQPDFTVLGTACDGGEAVRVCRELRPDVVLMDVRMPSLDGIEATRQLADAGDPGPRVLILTTFDLDEYVFDALRAGASGFLLKDVTAERLFDAVRVIAAGEALLAPAVTRRLISEFTRMRPVSGTLPSAVLGTLTPRETEVLRLVAEGMSNPEIARRLVVTEETVKTHVSRILAKLGLRDRTQAVVAAYESGLVVPGQDHG